MSIIFCSHVKDLTANLVQLMVQNYIENENKEKGLFTHGEIINDVDVFTVEIEKIPEINLKLKSNNPSKTTPKDLNVFFDILPLDSYVAAYEVKHMNVSYLFNFGNFFKFIDKIKYPETTELYEVLVPLLSDDTKIDCNNFEKLELEKESQYEIVKTFNEYKEKILKYPEEIQYKIFNCMKNNTGLYGQVITDVLMILCLKIGGNKEDNKYFSDYGERNISKEEFEKLKCNFQKATIRILTIDELSKYPINPDYLKRIIKLTE